LLLLVILTPEMGKTVQFCEADLHSNLDVIRPE
jgi:hypothetical protein